MTFDVVVRKGDTLPSFEKKFYVDGQPIEDLDDYDVTFTATSIDGNVLFENPATVVPDTNRVQYQFTDDDYDEIGNREYVFGHFTARQGGSVFTVPNSRPLAMLFTNTESFEYSYSGNPGGRPIDKIRFLLGDTNVDSAAFTDAEITYLFEEFGPSPYAAAAEAAERQVARYASARDKTVGPLSISFGSMSDRWSSLATSLRSRGASKGGAIAISTQTRSEPYFRTGMMDNRYYSNSYASNENPDALLGEEPL